jgi:hypothetical protein
MFNKIGQYQYLLFIVDNEKNLELFRQSFVKVSVYAANIDFPYEFHLSPN